MTILALGLLLFLGIHSISIVNEPLRDRLVRRFGEFPWKGIYSLPALVGFALICWGYGLARLDPVVLYPAPVWGRSVALVVLIPVFPLFVSTYLPGRIQRAAVHPTLLSLILWSVAHLMMNGTAADVLLFGAFLVWSVADWVSLSRREARVVPGAPERAMNDVLAILVGLGLYAAIGFWLHASLIGIPVFAL